MYQTQQSPYVTAPQYIRNTVSALGLKGRPVSSLEEARAASIDFDGSTFFFPDLANQKIYTKQINMDGTASMNMYALTPIPEAVVPTAADFITRKEFEETLAKIKEFLASAAPAPAPAANETPRATKPAAAEGFVF